MLFHPHTSKFNAGSEKRNLFIIWNPNILMTILNFRAKKIIWKHIDTIDRQKAVVISFLSNNKEEQKILSDILSKFTSNRGLGLRGRDFEDIKKKHGIPKASFWRIMQRLNDLGIIRISAGARLYYMVPDFSKALSKVSRAYRKMI